jgi:hypothetical protein
MFAEKYAAAVNSSDLRDDEHHHQTRPLMAAARADLSGSDVVMGSLLARVRYADGTTHKLFEAGTANLAVLLKIWSNVVRAKGISRGWLPVPRTEWDMRARESLFQRVAAASLALWLGNLCSSCNGTGNTADRRICKGCQGSGKAELPSGRLEAEKTRDMLSELEGLHQAHLSRASALLRQREEPAN